MPDDLPQCLTVWPGLQESGSAPARRASFFPPGELWLVPGELAKFQLREAFLRADVDGFRVVMAPRIHTFSSLENLLADELAPAEADELERRFLLSELAARLLPALGLKTKSGPEAGETGARPLPAVDSTLLCELADGLGDGFDRLRLAGISWDQLAAFPPSAFSTALAALGRRYDAALAALGRADRFAKRRRILEDLRAGRQFRALVGAEKIVCRWSQRFSPFESGLLAALMSQRQVEIKFNLPAWVRNEDLDHSSGFDLLRAVREVERGAADGPDALLEFSEGPPASEPALAYASEMLLAPPAYRLADPPPAGDRLNIVRAPTPYHEVEEAARRLKALAVQGHEPHHLALVVPDMEAYASLIDDVSRRFGLPFHLRRGEILGEKGPARAALDLLALWSSHWERPRVMRLLASPYFRLAEGDPAFWRRLALASGVTDDRAGGGFEDNLAKAASAEARALLEAVRMLKTAGRRLEEARDWPTFIGRFKAFLNQAGWPGDLDLAPLSPVNMREADLSAAFAFKEELERLEAALNSPHAPAVGLASFRLWLTKITEERRLVYDANPEGRVWVLNYYDLHGGVFDEIFCLGLNERVFPRTGPESRWWPDEFISALSRTALGRALWSGPADRYRQEEFMLAAALGQARERVWLYYSAADMSGRPALPSPLIESLRDLWSERAPEERPFEESRAWPVPPPLEAARGPDELWANLAALRPEDWPAELRGDRRLVEGLESLRRRSGIWAGMRRVARPGPEAVRRWLDALARHNESPLLRAAFFSSFAECPLAFWWGEALELDCDGPSLEEWPGSEEGTVLHLTLEKFFRSRLGRPWPEASASAAAGASGAASRDKLAAELQALAEKECL
ncbi:MAG: hypothetical protein LBS31_11320, partial [Candidatus Adiutrix sp.]|nr:hypothetical protein [Candidatus Adiutrix sp.]